MSTQNGKPTAVPDDEFMAKLVGAPPPARRSEGEQEPAPAETPKLPEPEAEETPRPIAKSPAWKAALNMTAIGSVLLAFSFLVGSINFAQKQPRPQAKGEGAEGALPDDPLTQSLAEKGELLADAAMARQSAELAALQQPQTVPQAAQVPVGPALPPPDKLPPIRTARNQPVPRRALRNLPRPTQPPQLPRRLSAGVSSSTSRSPVQSASTWTALAAAGNTFVQMSEAADRPATAPQATSTPVAQSQSVDLRAERDVFEERVSTGGLVSGSSARGRLTSPVVYEATSSISQTERYTVVLEEPLTGRGGKVVLNAGTTLLCGLEGVSPGNGLVRLTVVSILRPDGEEIPVRPGAISVRGNDGKPLIASNIFDRGDEIGGFDLGQFVLGGIGRAAEQFTRPQQSVVSAGVGGYTASTSFGAPNPVAGFLQGGSEVLLGPLAARNQQSIREVLRRPNVWMVAEDTPVQIFVNQATEL